MRQWRRVRHSEKAAARHKTTDQGPSWREQLGHVAAARHKTTDQDQTTEQLMEFEMAAARHMPTDRGLIERNTFLATAHHEEKVGRRNPGVSALAAACRKTDYHIPDSIDQLE